MQRHLRTSRPPKILLVLALAASLLVGSAVGVMAGDAFDDVDDNHPFHDEISWLAANDIATGFDDGEFKTTRAVSRQAMVSFLHRLAGEPEGPFPDPGFDDVDENDPFFDEIAWAVETGIATGFEDNTFRSTNAVSRQAGAAFLHRQAGGPEGPFPDPGFDDVDEDHRFFLEISWLADRGITTGFDDGEFKTTRAVARQAMAAFLFRFANEDFDGIELSWFDEVSTTPGEPFGADDVFATGDAGEAGQNGAEGLSDLSVDAGANTVTFEVEYSQVTGPFGDGPGLHIHEGERDENGPVVVFLATGAELDDNAEDGVITGTVTVDRDDFDVQDLINDPDEYYVNLHSDDFPAGAIRGQLPDGPPSIADEDVTSTWQLTATPDEVVDGGQPGAEATFELTFDSVNDVVCYEIVADNLIGGYESPAHTSTHIHQGDEGETGPPRVAFRNPEGDALERTSAGCHSVPQATNTGDPDNGVGFDLAEIEADPTNFYVDIHTDEHPEGAVRAQFEERAQVETQVQLNWQNEVGDVDGAQFPDGFTGERAQDSFDADGVDADVFFGDVDDTAATGLADDGNGDLTLRWNADEDFGNVFLEVTGTVTVTSELADETFAGFPIHIHEAALDVNGPVDLPLATPAAAPEVLEDLGGDRQLLRYTIDQTIRPEDVPGDFPALADTLAAIESDMATADEVGDAIPYYVNVHTEANLPGEVRGHLQAFNLLEGESVEVDGARSELPPVFKEIAVTAGDPLGSLVTLRFDVDVQDGLLDPDDFVVEVDGTSADVVTATAIGGEIELTIDAAADAGEAVEATILDGAATQIASDDRDGTAETSVRVRATTAD